MTFLNPVLLYAGLACIAVPIIVHLLTRRRRKPIAWGAMRFLLEAYKKHRRRLTLEQLLLLACRCALVALVGLALGKPVLQGLAAGSSGPRVLYLLVDNSLTSGVLDSAGRPALDRHKAAAQKLLAKLDPLRGDRAAVLALGSPPEALVVPASGDLGAVGRVIESLEATDSRADLAGALTRVGADLSAGDPGATAMLALLSEWRAGSADTDRSLPALISSVRPGENLPLVFAAEPAADPVDNVSVLRAEPLRPIMIVREEEGTPDRPGADPSAQAETSPVRVVLARRGPGVGDAAATKVRVRADALGATTRPGATAEAVVRWSPGQEQATATVSVDVPRAPSGASTFAIIAEIDRDGLAADNTCRRPVESRPSLGVGLATTPGGTRPASVDRFTPADWLRLAIAPAQDERERAAELRAVEIEPRTIGAGGTLAGLDALLVPAPDRLDGPAWTRIGEFARAGGLVVVFAPADAGVQLWADQLLKTTGLAWNIAREARTITPPMELADAPGQSDLFALLSGEFAELAKPVRVSRIVPVDPGRATADAVLRLRDGTPLLLAAPPRAPGGDTASLPPARGLIVLVASACDLAWTDLPTKPLMLPLVQEIIRQGVGAARGVWSGEAGSVPAIPAGTSELRAVGTDDVISIREGSAPAIRRAGLWVARDARSVALGVVAVNADLGAADTTPRARTELTPWLGAIAGPQRLQWSPELSGSALPAGEGAAKALETDQRPPFSAPILAAAAGIALLELLLARLFSHANVRADGPSSVAGPAGAPAVARGRAA